MATKKKTTKKPVVSKESAGEGKENSGKFQPGQSGNPVGRKSGSKNKRTLALRGLCEEEDFNPFKFLIEVAQNEDIEWRDRIKAACELNGCLNPKLKSVELDTSGDFEIRIVKYGQNNN